MPFRPTAMLLGLSDFFFFGAPAKGAGTASGLGTLARARGVHPHVRGEYTCTHVDLHI